MRKLVHSEIIDVRKDTKHIKEYKRHPIKLLLNNVRSLYNVGSIFRSSDSALVEEIILTGFTPHPPRKEIEKTALGATETVPWRYYKDANEAIKLHKEGGYKICALEITNNCRNYNDLSEDDFPILIIAGNEISGVDDEILELCDFSIEIPMYGVKHSLNVSVAVGIAIYNTLNIYNKVVKNEKN
ncbi:MAG TPA: RNA methyltransferase [Candidatus Kapabacteria bacterium]|nr:RNA methyltransferase [Candidatus Kapabacteria bacterium]